MCSYTDLGEFERAAQFYDKYISAMNEPEAVATAKL